MTNKKFIVTGHLQFAGIASTALTGQIRVTVPAKTQQEAEEKFKAFILAKAQPVVNSCKEQGPFDEVEKALRDIFK